MSSPAHGHRAVLRPVPVNAIMIFAVSGSLCACRGQPSEEPPLRVIKDMVQQPRSQSGSVAAELSRLGMSKGCVAQESVRFEASSAYRTGSDYLRSVPRKVDAELLMRGKQRFAVFCTPCHDAAGTGKGVIAQRGFPSPIDLAAPNVAKMPDGQLFEVITRGSRNMPGLAEQILPEDRWSIVAWVRVLQRSRDTVLADVEPDRVSQIQEAQGEP